MRVKDMWIVKTIDTIAEVVCDCAQFIGNVLLQYAICAAKGLTYIALIATAAIWVAPYIILKRIVKNQKSAEAYASEGEEKC